ncbi:MAG: hypothetical protein GC156_00395 [Actinomycetales bacterium]|nr:hypothetical protein [Actinomycetales bacterium]
MRGDLTGGSTFAEDAIARQRASIEREAGRCIRPRRVVAAASAALLIVVGMTVGGATAASAVTCPTDPTSEAAPGVDWSGCDLTSANLASVDLTGANLTGANLALADLSGAILTNALMDGVNLGGATVILAQMPGVHLAQGWLLDADLTGAVLSGADLSGAHMFGARLDDAVLSGADLSGLTMDAAHLARADLTNANLTNATVTSVDLTDADLTGANLTNVNLNGSDLSGANLLNVTAACARDTVLGTGITGTPINLPLHWFLESGTLLAPAPNCPSTSASQGVEVTFDGHGGTCSANPLTITVADGASYTPPTEGTGAFQCHRDGYTLAGWSHGATVLAPGGEDRDPDHPAPGWSPIAVESVTLYAVWRPRGVEITYDANVAATDRCADSSGNDVALAQRSTERRVFHAESGDIVAIAAPCTPLSTDGRPLRLAGWIASGRACAREIDPGQRLSDTGLAEGTKVHLFAVWVGAE